VAYLFVIAVSTILVGTGLALVAVNRADRRVHESVHRSTQAKYVALAGIEAALGVMDTSPNWRRSLDNGQWSQAEPFGPGTYTLSVTDADGDLGDDEADSVVITSTGDVAGAVSRMQVTAAPRPYKALEYACFVQSYLEIRSGAVVAGPMRAHQEIYSDGNYDSEENALFETMPGYYINSSLQPSRYATSALPYPQPSLSYYLALATPISGIAGGTARLSKYVLTPTTNSESPGQVNPNGIYSLNAAGKEVVIEKSHIKGTLIVHGTTKKVTFQRACWIESAGLSYPTLLIFTGGEEVDFNLDNSTLSESSENTDFNEDGDRYDSFPTDMRGIVWTQGSYIQIHRPYAAFTGCMIGGRIRIHDRATVNDDPSLAQQMIPGFIDPDMKIVPGTWREVQP